MHLYVHIPFCRQACHYCDFHFSTNISNKTTLVEAIASEIVLRKSYLPKPELSTIYFGGGTPSLLSEDEMDLLLDTVHNHFHIAKDAEITLEANPDDLTRSKLEQLAKAGINRLSIGLQSFYEPHLRFLNRVHTSAEAGICVKTAQDTGIENISVDLIYAIPSVGHDVLRSDIETAVNLNVSHISAYCLTIEPQTAFGKWVKTNRLQPIDEEFSAQQFEIMLDSLEHAGYEQYEISNFARNNQYSRHNTSYWQQRPYLGVGPSAHSYNGVSRESNIANNAKYVSAINGNTIPSQPEKLSAADQTNEYLLTGLRTKWGCGIGELDRLSAHEFEKQNQETLPSLVKNGWLKIVDNTLLLTGEGKLFADRVASDLFIES